jgi:hypothetical protein
MTDKPQPAEQNNRTNFEERNTLQMEQERLRQMVLTYIASRCDTDRLNAETRSKAPVAWKKPNGDGGITSPHSFITLPRGLNGRAAPHWLILVDSLGVHAPIGIEIVSDVVLGLSRQGFPSPDFDFASYNGADYGVSRRHAMVRPSNNHLYLIDLASTNGTRLNGLQLDPNRPMPVANGDMVSLGALTFCVKIIATPADYNSAHFR